MTDVARLPPSTRGPRHQWLGATSVTILPQDSTAGNERTERTCPRCGLVKITVHPPHGLPWREWRHPASAVTFPAGHVPPCRGGEGWSP